VAHAWKRRATRALVVAGLAGSIAAAATMDVPPGDPPGVALGSPMILAVERSALLFATWLATLVILAQAWQGRLPIEISGRGVRYADPAAVQASASAAEETLRKLEREFEMARREMVHAHRRSPTGMAKGR
jgi:hypothetical protein